MKPRPYLLTFFFVLTSFVIWFLLSCKNYNNGGDSDDPFKTKHDTTLALLMPWYKDSLPQVGKDGVFLITLNTHKGSKRKFRENFRAYLPGEKYSFRVFYKKKDSVFIVYHSFIRGNYAGIDGYMPDTVCGIKCNYLPPTSYILNDSIFKFTFRGNLTPESLDIYVNFKEKKVVFYPYEIKNFEVPMKMVNNFSEAVLPQLRYRQQCLLTDTNTIGRWDIGFGRLLRIFKKDGQYYKMEYEANGSGVYIPLQGLIETSEGYRIDKGNYKNYYTGDLAYSVIDKETRELKDYIIQQDRSFKHEYTTDCISPYGYTYMESDIDSMFYYGYDTIPASILLDPNSKQVREDEAKKKK